MTKKAAPMKYSMPPKCRNPPKPASYKLVKSNVMVYSSVHVDQRHVRAVHNCFLGCPFCPEFARSPETSPISRDVAATKKERLRNQRLSEPPYVCHAIHYGFCTVVALPPGVLPRGDEDIKEKRKSNEQLIPPWHHENYNTAPPQQPPRHPLPQQQGHPHIRQPRPHSPQHQHHQLPHQRPQSPAAPSANRNVPDLALPRAQPVRAEVSVDDFPEFSLSNLLPDLVTSNDLTELEKKKSDLANKDLANNNVAAVDQPSRKFASNNADTSRKVASNIDTSRKIVNNIDTTGKSQKYVNNIDTSGKSVNNVDSTGKHVKNIDTSRNLLNKNVLHADSTRNVPNSNNVVQVGASTRVSNNNVVPVKVANNNVVPVKVANNVVQIDTSRKLVDSNVARVDVPAKVASNNAATTVAASKKLAIIDEQPIYDNIPRKVVDSNNTLHVDSAKQPSKSSNNAVQVAEASRKVVTNTAAHIDARGKFPKGNVAPVTPPRKVATNNVLHIDTPRKLVVHNVSEVPRTKAELLHSQDLHVAVAKPMPKLFQEQREASKRQKSPRKVNVPQFYFPYGKPIAAAENEAILKRVEEVFKTLPDQKAERTDMDKITQACKCPKFWRVPLYNAAGGESSDCVTAQAFMAMWRRITKQCHDDESRFFRLLSKPGCTSLTSEDFIPFVQDIVDSHPGLTFLQDAPEFHSRYITTVIARIFYTINRSWTGRITLPELRRCNLLSVIALLEEEDDINQITDYFSYEHFYVVYCKFWELDTDHDLYIDKKDLSRHQDHALSTRMLDRIFTPGAVLSSDSVREGRMSYSEFVWFLISEEDKKQPVSIEYWFRCMDLDGDGCLSMFELEYFYEEQLNKMESLGIETLPFEDCLCQLLDLVKPKKPGFITLRDLKNCKLAHIFFDTLFNLEKFLEHEQRDPFASSNRDYDSEGPEPTDWEKYALEEYEMLVAEEGGGDTNAHSLQGEDGDYSDDFEPDDDIITIDLRQKATVSEPGSGEPQRNQWIGDSGTDNSRSL